jgi:hypothetical protein
MNKKILEVLENNKIYPTSRIEEKTFERDGEDDDGNIIYFDVNDPLLNLLIFVSIGYLHDFCCQRC